MPAWWGIPTPATAEWLEGIRQTIADIDAAQAAYLALSEEDSALVGADRSAKLEALVSLAEGLRELTTLAAGGFASGDGTENAPYIIKTQAHFNAMVSAVNEGDGDGNAAHYKLADEAVGLIATTAIGIPYREFKGSFDGNGKVITLDIDAAGKNHQGLFGSIGRGGVVKNVGVSGRVSGNYYADGVAGYNYSGTVKNCYNTGAVSGSSDSSYVGGVVGYNSNGTVEHCYNTGNVGSSENSDVGGVAGYNLNGTVQSCVSLGFKVTGASRVGRVVGQTGQGSILADNRARADMRIGAAGGEGTVPGGGSADDTNGLNAAPGAGTKQTEVFSGWNTETVWDAISGSLTAGVALPTLQAFPSGSQTPTLPANPNDASFADGGGAEDDPYIIKTQAHFDAMVSLVNNGSGTENRDHYKLAPEAVGLTAAAAIGTLDRPFTGSFDGNGKEIALSINNASKDNQGLFGYIGAGGMVKNVGVAGTVSGNSTVGGVAGYNSGTVQNCYSTAAVSGRMSDVGGVAGYNNNGTLESCHNTGTASGGGSRYVGGVAGYNSSGTVENCYNTGTVSGGDGDGDGRYAGGVAGYNSNGMVEGCYNTGTVSGNIYVGGVVGDNSNSTIEETNNSTVQNCYNTGMVSGSSSVGGVAGYNTGTVEHCHNTAAVSGSGTVGGVAGYNYSGTVQSCHNTGAVSGNDDVGGVAGENSGTVQNCYNTAAVSGGSGRIGGVAGYNPGTVEHCYNTGMVSGYSDSAYIGGVAGYNDGTVKNCVSLGFKVTGNYNVGRVAGYTNNEGGALANNRARADMRIVAAGSEDTVSDGSADDINGADVTVGANTAQTTVFSGWNTETVWNTMIGSLTMGAVLPTLQGFPAGSQAPTLQNNPNDALFADGDGSREDPYIITTQEHFNAMVTVVNDGSGSGAYYKLADNAASLTATAAIGTFGRPFTGSFDGSGKEITLNIATSTDYQGLFGCIGAGGVVKNVGVAGTVSGSGNVGGVAGVNGGTVQSCYNTAEVSGDTTVGGVAGYNTGTVENCYNTDAVSATNAVGGVAGHNTGTVENCYNTDAVSATNAVGGVAGYNTGTVGNCYNTGAVSGTNDVGGVVGYTDGGTVRNCVSLGLKVTGPNNVGRVVGVSVGEVSTLANNQARADMKIGAAGSEAAVQGGRADGINGADVTVGAGTAQADVFSGWDRTAWDISGKLDAGAALPTLKGFPAGSQAPAVSPYTVTFDPNSGSLSQTTAVTGEDGKLPSLPTPSRSNYSFTGWYTAASGGTRITTDTVFTGNATVYAHWDYTGGGDGGGGGGGGGGDGGGGGGGNSGSDTKPSEQPGQNGTNAPTEGAVKPAGKVDQSGKLEVAVTEKDIKDAIARATAQAKRDGNQANGIAVTIDLTGVETGFDQLPLTLSKETCEALVDAGVKSLEIRTSQLSLSLDLATLKTIHGAATGGVTIRAEKADATKLPADTQKALGGRPLYDLTITSGGKTVSTFGGYVTIALPYTLKEGEQGGNLQLAYVGADGKVNYITDSSYDAEQKALIGRTAHFTVFGIAEKQTPDFADIGGHWAEDDILFVVSRGLLNGTGGKTFSPNSSMTSGMFVTALGRLAGIDPAGYRTGKFTDVASDAYYAPYVNWAASKGIVSGTTTTTFAPDQPVTRQQMAVIMQNYAKAMGYTVPKTREAATFTDNGSIAGWAEDAVKAMQMAGILNGKDGNRFDPTGTATRAEVSAVLHRYVELVIDPATAQGWDKNDSGKWLYYVDGKPVTGERKIDGTTYHFDGKGQLTKIDAVAPEDKKYLTYVVQKDDTLWGIAAKHNCTVAEIVALNRELIADPNQILMG